MSDFLTEKLLLREATLTQEFVDSIVQTDGIYRYFTSHQEKGIDPEFMSFFQLLANMPDVVKGKVYDADMVLLWDSEPAKIGEIAHQNEELELSWQGNLVTEFGLTRSADKEEHKNLQAGGEDVYFIETYIPVWNADHSKVVGSLELYKLPRILHEAIVEGRFLVWGIAIFGAAVLFASLFWIVIRANSIIQKQQSQLVESESLSMIGETASAVAHAMRNALASIRASAELTLEDDLEGARESASDIISESDRLNRWATELLRFSGDGGDKLHAINIVDLLNEVIHEHQLVLTKEKVSLITDFKGKALMVEASEAPLSQVFGNLIMNAIEAMDGDGELTIKAYQLTEDPSILQLEFIDNGCGLSSEIIGQLFKPFATTKPTGTGLGLALTRRLLSRFDGQVSIHSGKGKGVTAKIMLPLIG